MFPKAPPEVLVVNESFSEEYVSSFNAAIKMFLYILSVKSLYSLVR